MRGAFLLALADLQTVWVVRLLRDVLLFLGRDILQNVGFPGAKAHVCQMPRTNAQVKVSVGFGSKALWKNAFLAKGANNLEHLGAMHDILGSKPGWRGVRNEGPRVTHA